MLSLRRQLFPDPVSGLYAGALALCVAYFLVWGMVDRTGPVDRTLHDTYYVVLPWHFTVSIGAAAVLFMLAYRFFRLVIGTDYRRGLAIAQWLNMVLGSTLLLAPALWTGWAGPPAHDADYTVMFARLRGIASAGYLLSLLSSGLFVICVGEAIWRRHRSAKPRRPERTDP